MISLSLEELVPLDFQFFTLKILKSQHMQSRMRKPYAHHPLPTMEQKRGPPPIQSVPAPQHMSMPHTTRALHHQQSMAHRPVQHKPQPKRHHPAHSHPHHHHHHHPHHPTPYHQSHPHVSHTQKPMPRQPPPPLTKAIPSTTTKFKAGDTVFARSGPLLYKAKILQTRLNEKKGLQEYFVHYHNWNKNWDEWKTEVLADNPDNRKRVRMMNDTQKSLKQQKRSFAPYGKRKRRKLDRHQCHFILGFETAQRLQFDIPKSLKRKLQVDHEFIHSGKVNFGIYELPTTKPNVKEILKEFVQTVHSGPRPNLKRHIDHMVEGLLDYFDHAFSRNLLYKTEKKSYDHYFQTSKQKPREACGLIFLLRLLLKLPHLASYSTVDHDQIQIIKGTCQALVRFLRKNYEKYEMEKSENGALGLRLQSTPTFDLKL